MKYTLCIKLNIDGKETEQELATFSLKALEKYTSYCDVFSSSNPYSEIGFINCLRKTHPKIANFLNEHKVSEQPLFIKCGDEYTDIPVLYKKDIDVLLITQDELNKLLDYYNSVRASSFEDKIRLGVGLKEFIEENKLFNLNKEAIINEKGKTTKTTEKDKRLKELNESLDSNKENYWDVVKQIEFNIRPLIEVEERKNDKSESEEMQPNYVVTGMRHEEDADEDKKYTIADELENYRTLRDKAKTPEEQRILSMLVETTKKVIEYREILKSKNNSDPEVRNLQIILAEYEVRMNDLLSGNVHFGDGELEIDDLNYGGR